jgi:hypothetical protein
MVNPIIMLETIADAIESGKDLMPMLDEIRQFIDRTKDVTSNEHTAIITKIIAKVTEISDDANSIINSLQIQDITAQQLAAVNHLLENVQGRLTGILSHLNPEEVAIAKNSNSGVDESIMISKLHRNIAFDPDAVDSITAENRQDDIDAMLANPDIAFASAEENDSISAEDLLNSFATNASNNNTADAPNAPDTAVDDEEFSQDDIDALFS